jgi:FkbM family methyltransferase
VSDNCAYGLPLRSSGDRRPLELGRSWRRLQKAIRLLGNRRFRRGLRRGVAAAIEHRHLASVGARTVVDVGAHHGQFTLLALELFPEAEILAFEPLAGARRRFSVLLGDEPRVRIYPHALGRVAGVRPMLVAARDDCSSLLPARAACLNLLPELCPVACELVSVVRLGDVVEVEQIRRPALLKIDVQGFEGEVLAGLTPLLPRFDVIYLEASFCELCVGQALIRDLLLVLERQGFSLSGVYNPLCDGTGRALQADFDFRRSDRARARTVDPPAGDMVALRLPGYRPDPLDCLPDGAL